MLLVSPAAALGQEPGGRYVSMTPVVGGAQAALAVEVGAGKIIDLHRPAANVFVANPKVVDVRPASASTFFVFGLAPGRSTVAALDAAGRRIASYDVQVLPSSFASDEAKSQLADQLPDNRIDVHTTANGLQAGGSIDTPEQASEAQADLESSLPPGGKVDDRLEVNQSVQVLLRVRVAEMSRNVTRQLGVNWQAVGTIVGSTVASPAFSAAQGAVAALVPTAAFSVGYFNGGINVNAAIDALAADNSAHLLAEPDLMAMSGHPADFLVGGEYPIPTSSSLGQINVTYKEYGVRLDFIPTVMSTGRIQLHVRPEVSALTTQGAIQTGSGSTAIVIPALTIRRADTTVELGSGESFAIAGMLQKNSTQSDSGIPGLGDVPLLGALFRTDDYQHQDTELVIIVTPYLVRPVDKPSTLMTPAPAFTPPNDLERLFLLRQTALGTPAQPAPDQSFPSEAGFIVE